MRLRGFFKRLLGPSVVPFPPAETDWQAGDLARCIVSDGPEQWVGITNRECGHGPAQGQTLKVRSAYADETSTWLCFAAFPGNSYPAGYFRKIRPDAPKACHEGFRLRIKGLRPKVDA